MSGVLPPDVEYAVSRASSQATGAARRHRHIFSWGCRGRKCASAAGAKISSRASSRSFPRTCSGTPSGFGGATATRRSTPTKRSRSTPGRAASRIVAFHVLAIALNNNN